MKPILTLLAQHWMSVILFLGIAASVSYVYTHRDKLFFLNGDDNR